VTPSPAASRRAAAGAFDQRDVGAADAAAFSESVEGVAARIAQLAHAACDAGVDVHASSLLEILSSIVVAEEQCTRSP
jgi:hypothetical protein